MIAPNLQTTAEGGAAVLSWYLRHVSLRALLKDWWMMQRAPANALYDNPTRPGLTLVRPIMRRPRGR